MRYLFVILFTLIQSINVFGQDTLPFTILLKNAFPAASNNTNMYVIDPVAKRFWLQSLNRLPNSIKEQLQSTNMNFEQVGDTLYIIGGYAFSQTSNSHITFPNLTTVHVSGLMNSIIDNDTVIRKYFRQISNEQFAVTGGHLTQLNDTFLLVGGHRFDGRYNAMGNPSYTQAYTNQIRRFSIDNSDTSIAVRYLDPITNEVHLHRRDYNLIPRINKDSSLGYTISSGVFQTTANLPYLYPVDILSNTIRPITSFNQYLSNYHSAVANIYFLSKQEQYNIFFGGMSQYYYQNDTLFKDDNVPFTKTISALKRNNDTALLEIKLPIELEALKGASAEFIINKNNPLFLGKFTNVELTPTDTITLGHIYGGITSTARNPFTNNQTNNTSADANIYEVVLVKRKNDDTNDTLTGTEILYNMPSIKALVYPNPAKDKINLNLDLPETGNLQMMWLNMEGKLNKQDNLLVNKGPSKVSLELPITEKGHNLMLVLSLNNRYFSNHIIQQSKK
jgi:hypothetical protein